MIAQFALWFHIQSIPIWWWHNDQMWIETPIWYESRIKLIEFDGCSIAAAQTITNRIQSKSFQLNAKTQKHSKLTNVINEYTFCCGRIETFISIYKIWIISRVHLIFILNNFFEEAILNYINRCNTCEIPMQEAAPPRKNVVASRKGKENSIGV